MCSSPINVRMHLSSIPSSCPFPLVTGYTCSTSFLLKLPYKALRCCGICPITMWHISTKHETHTPVCISQSQGHLLPGVFFKLEIHLLTWFNVGYLQIKRRKKILLVLYIISFAKFETIQWCYSKKILIIKVALGCILLELMSVQSSVHSQDLYSAKVLNKDMPYFKLSTALLRDSRQLIDV